MMKRTSARVILLDDDGAVLLLCGSDPAITDGSAPRWWFTVGGRARQGERLTRTAVRELAEETGLQAPAERIVGPVWRRESQFSFNGVFLDSEEFYFVHRTRRFDPSSAGRTALERRYIHGHRWCDAAAIDELVALGQQVFPPQLAELLTEAHALATALEDPGDPRPIG